MNEVNKSVKDPNDLVYYPHKALVTAARTVEEFDSQLTQNIIRMSLNVKHFGGVGLAANQIGLLQRIIVTHYKGLLRAYVNPIIHNGTGEFVFTEGCLSHPDIHVPIKRFKEFDLEFQDPTGSSYTEHFVCSEEDITGTIIQHEVDHLSGRNIIDHLDEGLMNSGQIYLIKNKLDKLAKKARK